MTFTLRNTQNKNYVACPTQGFVMQNERDVLDLMALCGEFDTNNVMIYHSNLSADFFDLKTGFAGTLFQKFANYKMRAAIIVIMENIKSERFRELVFEHSRSHFLRFYEDESEAEKWLANLK